MSRRVGSQILPQRTSSCHPVHSLFTQASYRTTPSVSARDEQRREEGNKDIGSRHGDLTKEGRMSGPFSLRYLHLFVGEKSPGTFILSRNGRLADYVGVSMEDVAGAIRHAARQSSYRYFWFAVAASAGEAAQLGHTWFTGTTPPTTSRLPRSLLDQRGSARQTVVPPAPWRSLAIEVSFPPVSPLHCSLPSP